MKMTKMNNLEFDCEISSFRMIEEISSVIL